MKVLLLNDRIPPEGRGGAESVAWRLAQGLKAAGHDVHVAAATEKASFEETRQHIPTYHLHAGYPERFRAWLSLWNPQTVNAFRAMLARLQPDVVNAHNIHSYLSYHTLKLAREAGCGVVFSSHDAMPFAYGKLTQVATQDARSLRLPAGYNLRQNRFRYNPFRNPVIKRTLNQYADFCTVPSRALAQAFADNDMPPVEVVHNGIDPDDWAPADEAALEAMRQRLDLQGKRVILIAGRLTAEKGMQQTLLALDRLRQTLPEVRLLVLTSRDIDSQIPAAFAHLRPFIRSGGWLSGDELRAAFQLADVVTVPSIYLDPFPTVNLEAMASGVPVVATSFGGSDEVVVDGETGYIVNPLDVETFAGRLESLLTDSALRTAMGQRGKERIRAKFSLERQVGQMAEIYQRTRQSR